MTGDNVSSGKNKIGSVIIILFTLTAGFTGLLIIDGHKSNLVSLEEELVVDK
jgi:hypothetical protein